MLSRGFVAERNMGNADGREPIVDGKNASRSKSMRST
jgi:hypothetical protein